MIAGSLPGTAAERMAAGSNQPSRLGELSRLMGRSPCSPERGENSFLRCGAFGKVYSVRRFARHDRSPMHKSNSIIMQAPREKIFETAANLELWPQILPHYRYIRYLKRAPNRNVVVMAATRSGIPISWTSEQIIDREQLEVRFHHLKAWTKGMRVVWTFKETVAGVRVEIVHELSFRVPSLAPIADIIVGDFFIHHVANETLRCMKLYLEEQG